MSIVEHVLVLETRYRIFKRVRKKLEYAPREELEQIIREYEATPRIKKFLDGLMAGFAYGGLSERGLEHQISKFIVDGNLEGEALRRNWEGTEEYFRKPLERYVDTSTL